MPNPTSGDPSTVPALTSQRVEQLRGQFPALHVEHAGEDGVSHVPAFFDGPAGTQVPRQVIEAIGDYLVNHSANHGGCFPTSVKSDRLLDRAHQAAADFLGADDPTCISFGANMTSLTFALSRALARTWNPGDEILVTQLDHDANVTPWVLAARDAGVQVKTVQLDPTDCTLDLEDLRSKLSSRTRLVAIGYASNASGSINPLEQIIPWIRETEALVFVDAVHLAPHRRIQVQKLGCDFLACSAYKFFGPHIGIQWGRRELLSKLETYKVRPASNDLPDKWMTGTQNHECLAGTLAAIDYLAQLAPVDPGASRPTNLDNAFAAIDCYERELSQRILEIFASNSEIRVWGITDPERLGERAPTFSITHARLSPADLSRHLAKHGIYTWHGNYYALSMSEALGREPEGMVRVGLVHYNTHQELDRLAAALSEV